MKAKCWLIFKLLFLKLMLCWSKSVISYEGYRVLRVEVTNPQQREELYKLGGLAEFWSDLPGQHADLMVSPSDLANLEERLNLNGFRFFTMIENVAHLMRLERSQSIDTRKNVPIGDHPMTWTEYHSLSDIDAYLDYLEITYPEIVTFEDIGRSFQGRKMRVCKICKGGCGNKPALWIDGGIHAREWIAPAAVTFIIHQLVEIQDPDESDLLNKLDWYILPLVNPDGYEYTRKGDRLWRKTMSLNGQPCIGVDANRNWDYHFNEGGSSDASCSETYHGPNAFSEIENENVRNFILTHKDQIKFYNNIHSYSQLILLPWGFTKTRPDNYEKLFRLASTANKALNAVHNKDYKIGSIPALLYYASGGSTDWALGVANIPYSYAMELRDTGRHGFILPPEEIIPTSEEVFAFHKSAGRQILEEFVR